MMPKQPRPFLRALTFGGVFLLSMTALKTFAEAQMLPGGPSDRSEVRQVAEQLRLGMDQQKEFFRIVDDFQMSVEAVMEKYGIDPAESRPPPSVRVAFRSDLRMSVTRMDEELAAILTASQLRAFQHMRRRQMLAP